MWGSNMHSSAFRKFKQEIGQANHFLITILIGLDAVEDGAQKRPEFHASWNPESVSSSVRRSKLYALKSALAWTVDNLDMYLRLANRIPQLFGDEESAEIAKTKHSVYNKFRVVIDHHAELDVSIYAYIDLLICWRNNTTHFDADNKLLPSSKSYFLKIINHEQTDVTVEKYHLDVDSMMKRYQAGDCPTFKEMATLINMTIRFVKLLDQVLIADTQQPLFLENTLYSILKIPSAKDHIFTQHALEPNIRIKKIKQLLACNGITESFYNDVGEKYLSDIAQKDGKQFIEELRRSYS